MKEPFKSSACRNNRHKGWPVFLKKTTKFIFLCGLSMTAVWFVVDYKMRASLVVMLLLSILMVGVSSRKLLDADVDVAMEHQRILAELEEVHQLRERMLQEGEGRCMHLLHPQ